MQSHALTGLTTVKNYFNVTIGSLRKISTTSFTLHSFLYTELKTMRIAKEDIASAITRQIKNSGAGKCRGILPELPLQATRECPDIFFIFDAKWIGLVTVYSF